MADFRQFFSVWCFLLVFRQVLHRSQEGCHHSCINYLTYFLCVSMFLSLVGAYHHIDEFLNVSFLGEWEVKVLTRNEEKKAIIKEH